MTIHSSVLAWRLPRMEKSGGLQSVRWHTVGHTRHVARRRGHACSEFSELVPLRSVRFLSLSHLSPFGQGFPGGLTRKESMPAAAGDVGSIPVSGRWRPAPVFLPGKSQGWRSLAGRSPWGHQRVRHDLENSTATTLFVEMQGWGCEEAWLQRGACRQGKAWQET